MYQVGNFVEMKKPHACIIKSIVGKLHVLGQISKSNVAIATILL